MGITFKNIETAENIETVKNIENIENFENFETNSSDDFSDKKQRSHPILSVDRVVKTATGCYPNQFQSGNYSDSY